MKFSLFEKLVPLNYRSLLKNQDFPSFPLTSCLHLHCLYVTKMKIIFQSIN